MPKITQLIADTAPTSDDLTVIVNDPAGTPGTKKATLANVITKAHGLTDGIVSAGSGTLNTTLSLDTDGTLAANSDTRIASQKATKTYTDNVLGNANALVYKGVIDCSTNPDYPAADAGFLYVVSVAGKIGGASGIDVEVGDMVICNTDGTASGDQATVGQYWNIIQKNIVGAVTGPASAVTDNIAVFDGTTGKIIKDSGAKTSDFITKALIDAKGDLIVGSAADTPAILTSSAVNGNVLTVDTSTATGLKWAAPAGGGQVLYDIVVAPSGGDYTTLTAALAAATSGQTIFVKSGTYTETRDSATNITTTNLTIIGENRESTILQCGNTYGFRFTGAGLYVANLRFEVGNTSSVTVFSGAQTIVENCEFLLQNTSTGATYQFSISGANSRLNNCYLETTTTTQNQADAIIAFGMSSGSVSNTYIKLSTMINSTTNGTIRMGANNSQFSNIVIENANTTITGSGAYAVGLMSGGMSFNNVTFVMSNTSATRRGTAVYSNGDKQRFTNCYFIHASVGLEMNGSDRMNISNCLFENCGTGILSSALVEYSTIAGCSFENFTDNGINIQAGTTVISACSFQTQQTPITISGSNNYPKLITGCSIRRAGSGNNISSSGFNVSILANASYYGTISNSARGSVISGNSMVYLAGVGVSNSGADTAIIGNRIQVASGVATDYPVSNTAAYTVIADNNISANAIINNTSATASIYNNHYDRDSENTTSSLYAGDLPNEYKTIFMKNTSGGALAAGDVVVLKSVAGMNEVTTTTTAGDNKVFGMAVEAIADNAVGKILVKGKTTVLKVNGTSAIAVGDYLTAFTTAKIAAKATTGNMVFAIALEAYSGADNNGVIDALLIDPRLI